MHIADYAAFDEESLMRHFMDTDITGKSREQMTQEITEQWGGIDKSLDYCRKEMKNSCVARAKYLCSTLE